MLRVVLFFPLLALLLNTPIQAAGNSPAGGQEIEYPAWFAQSFLEFDEEVRDAGKAGKRVLIYFTQAGCPYCRELTQTSFSQQDIVAFTRSHYVPIALDIWGDRDVTWIDGSRMTEKVLVQRLKVQFTPTILLLDEKGEIAARLNGYYPPHRFRAALHYGADPMAAKTAFAAYLKTNAVAPARPSFTEEPFFAKPPYPLPRGASKKPLIVIFEYKDCASCDTLHDQTLANPAVRRELPRFDVVRLNLFGRDSIRTTEGAASNEAEWAAKLGVIYAPTVIFFDAQRHEALRIESDIKAGHLLGAMRYVTTGAYVKEANFQRFIREHYSELEKSVKETP